MSPKKAVKKDCMPEPEKHPHKYEKKAKVFRAVLLQYFESDEEVHLDCDEVGPSELSGDIKIMYIHKALGKGTKEDGFDPERPGKGYVVRLKSQDRQAKFIAHVESLCLTRPSMWPPVLEKKCNLHVSLATISQSLVASSNME